MSSPGWLAPWVGASPTPSPGLEPVRGVAREEAVARDEAVARVGLEVAVADGDPGRVEVAVRYLEVRHVFSSLSLSDDLSVLI